MNSYFNMTPHAGEWWNGDVEEVENEMLKSGGGPNNSDAYTINGLPGPLYPCSSRGKYYTLHFLNFHFVISKSNTQEI